MFTGRIGSLKSFYFSNDDSFFGGFGMTGSVMEVLKCVGRFKISFVVQFVSCGEIGAFINCDIQEVY